MPKTVKKLDSENFGDGQGVNGNVANVLQSPLSKKPYFGQKSLSFDDNVTITRGNTVDGTPDGSIKRRRKKKKHGDLYNRMAESFADFAGHTSSHGIPRAYAAPKGVKTWLWIILFFICLGIFTFQAVLIINRYFRHDIIVGVELKFENIPFPSVTVCNLNPYKNSLARALGSVRDTLLAFDNAIESSLETQGLQRRKRAIDNGRQPEVKIVQTLCAVTSDGMYYPSDDSVNEHGLLHDCYCLNNNKNGYSYDCALIMNWKQKQCNCADNSGICEKLKAGDSGEPIPCLCRENQFGYSDICIQNEYDQAAGSWPIEFYTTSCNCDPEKPQCTPTTNDSSESVETCYCAKPSTYSSSIVPYCAPATHWQRSKCIECNWDGQCVRTYSLEAVQDCLCHDYSTAQSKAIYGQYKCLSIDYIDESIYLKPVESSSTPKTSTKSVRIRREIKKVYEKIYNRYDGLLAVYSMCQCRDGLCTALKDNTDGAVCLCFFNRKNGQIWPCYPPEMWSERKCHKCSPLGDCTYADDDGRLPCVCAAIIRMCVRIEERSSTEVKPFESDNTSTSSSRELIDDILEKETFKLADVIPKIWEITTTEAPIPEDVQEKQMAYGFKGVSDPVAIRAKASENLVFAVSSLKEDEKSKLSYSKQEIITKCSFNGRQCSVDKDFDVYIDPSFGNCFTFNYNASENITIERAGPYYGLRFQVFVNISDYLPTTESAGVRLTVHSPDEQPFPDALGYSAPTGFVSSFGIRLKRVNRLPSPHGDCAVHAKDSEYIYRDKEYSTEGCQRSCIQRYLVSKCGCGDPRFPVYRNSSNCLVDNSRMRTCLKKELRNAAQDRSCVCKQPCQQVVFSVSYSCARWPASTSSLSDCDPSLTPGQCLQYYREQGAFIEVYFEQLNYESLLESEAYGIPNLLSDFGGQLGLWMGVSVITIMEFLILVSEMFLNLCFWTFGKADERKPSFRYSSRMFRYPNGAMRYMDMLPQPHVFEGLPYKNDRSPPLPTKETGCDIVRTVR